MQFHATEVKIIVTQKFQKKRYYTAIYSAICPKFYLPIDYVKMQLNFIVIIIVIERLLNVYYIRKSGKYFLKEFKSCTGLPKADKLNYNIFYKYNNYFF